MSRVQRAQSEFVCEARAAQVESRCPKNPNYRRLTLQERTRDALFKPAYLSGEIGRKAISWPEKQALTDLKASLFPVVKAQAVLRQAGWCGACSQ